MEKSNHREIDIFESGRIVDKSAVALALLLTVLIHIATICLMPTTFSVFEPFNKEKADNLKLEILPPKQKPRLPDFVEANPFANMESPQTPNAPESFQDQRAAEELPDPSSKSKKPFVEGEIKDGKKIVEGTSAKENIINPKTPFETLERPLERPAPLDKPEALQATESQIPQKVQESNVSADENKGKESINTDISEGKEKSSEKSTFSEVGELSPVKLGGTDSIDTVKKSKKSTKNKNQQPLEESSPNGTKPTEQQNKSSQVPQIPKTDNSLPAPKPRPYLSMKIPAGPLADSNTRASHQGRIAVDSRFSEFGAYQQRMIEAISRQWNLLGANYDLSTAVNTQIVIEFILDPKGDLVSLVVLYSNSTHTGRALCEQSILTTAPYGEWTRDMIATLGGQNQEVRITFHYR